MWLLLRKDLHAACKVVAAIRGATVYFEFKLVRYYICGGK